MPRKNLLIVDDEEDIGEILATLLENDFDCEFVSSGKQALDLIREKSYDGIITDLEMPDTNGLTIIREVIALKKKTALFVSTGHDSEHPKVQAALGAGACDILFKPFLDPERLVDKIFPHLS